MLNIGKLFRGMDAKHYFLDRVARDQRDYYTGAGEAPGSGPGRPPPTSTSPVK